MRRMRSLLVSLVGVVTACAQAGSGEPRVGDIDASVRSDSSISLTDSSVTPPVDAPPAGCTTMTKNMLRNDKLDGTPAGVDWQSTPIDAAYPIITGDAGGVAAQSGTIRAWMGGLERSASLNKDALYQDVVIPAMTTKLEFKGFYDVRTGELDGSVYDRATVELTTTTNTQLELVKALDDNGATTAWTAFTKTFTSQYSGMTVRLRFSTASDSLDPTSFFFDTLELNATFCQ